MPAITVLALLNEGNKLEIYDKRAQAAIASFPHMDQDGQEAFMENLRLPDDVLSDILDSETPDDINTAKEALNGY